jgi:hypothetical protein
MVLQKPVYSGLLYRPQIVISTNRGGDERWSEEKLSLERSEKS